MGRLVNLNGQSISYVLAMIGTDFPFIDATISEDDCIHWTSCTPSHLQQQISLCHALSLFILSTHDRRRSPAGQSARETCPSSHVHGCRFLILRQSTMHASEFRYGTSSRIQWSDVPIDHESLLEDAHFFEQAKILAKPMATWNQDGLEMAIFSCFWPKRLIPVTSSI
jgi:hypothetical protein